MSVTCEGSTLKKRLIDCIFSESAIGFLNNPSDYESFASTFQRHQIHEAKCHHDTASKPSRDYKRNIYKLVEWLVKTKLDQLDAQYEAFYSFIQSDIFTNSFKTELCPNAPIESSNISNITSGKLSKKRRFHDNQGSASRGTTISEAITDAEGNDTDNEEGVLLSSLIVNDRNINITDKQELLRVANLLLKQCGYKALPNEKHINPLSNPSTSSLNGAITIQQKVKERLQDVLKQHHNSCSQLPNGSSKPLETLEFFQTEYGILYFESILLIMYMIYDDDNNITIQVNSKTVAQTLRWLFDLKPKGLSQNKGIPLLSFAMDGDIERINNQKYTLQWYLRCLHNHWNSEVRQKPSDENRSCGESPLPKRRRVKKSEIPSQNQSICAVAASSEQEVVDTYISSNGFGKNSQLSDVTRQQSTGILTAALPVDEEEDNTAEDGREVVDNSQQHHALGLMNNPFDDDLSEGDYPEIASVLQDPLPQNSTSPEWQYDNSVDINYGME